MVFKELEEARKAAIAAREATFRQEAQQQQENDAKFRKGQKETHRLTEKNFRELRRSGINTHQLLEQLAKAMDIREPEFFAIWQGEFGPRWKTPLPKYLIPFIGSPLGGLLLRRVLEEKPHLEGFRSTLELRQEVAGLVRYGISLEVNAMGLFLNNEKISTVDVASLVASLTEIVKNDEKQVIVYEQEINP
jgi:hypothetical protein